MGCASTLSWARDAVRVESVEKCAPRNPEQSCCLRLIAVAPLERAQDRLALRGGVGACGGIETRGGRGRDSERAVAENDVLRLDRLVGTQDHGAIDDISQLADVARPGVLLELLQSGGRDAEREPSHFFA